MRINHKSSLCLLTNGHEISSRLADKKKLYYMSFYLIGIEFRSNILKFIFSFLFSLQYPE